MKRLGLFLMAALLSVATPGIAAAAGWRGGGGNVGHGGGGAWHGGGGGGWHGNTTGNVWHGGGGGTVYRGGAYGGGWRGGYAPGYAPGYRAAPGYYGGHVYARPLAPSRYHVWVPGYWGYHSGARVWIDGSWLLPPYAGWTWIAGHWAWNGYTWVWQDGYWGPPY